MTAYSSLFVFLVAACYNGSNSQATNVTYFDSSVMITSADYPYIPGVNYTWIWNSTTGVFGVKFNHLHLGRKDFIVVVRENKQRLYVYPDQNVYLQRLYSTSSPFLNISLYTSLQSRNQNRGCFQLDIKIGRDKHHLESLFLKDNKIEFPAKQQEFLPILLTIATIVLFLFIGVILLFACRRHQCQLISLRVYIQGIRRDSGVRHTRNTSTNSEPRQNECSNRSWANRAEVTTTICNRAADHQQTSMNIYKPVCNVNVRGCPVMMSGMNGSQVSHALTNIVDNPTTGNIHDSCRMHVEDDTYLHPCTNVTNPSCGYDNEGYLAASEFEKDADTSVGAHVIVDNPTTGNMDDSCRMHVEDDTYLHPCTNVTPLYLVLHPSCGYDNEGYLAASEFEKDADTSVGAHVCIK